MIAAQRHQLILERLRVQGAVSAAALSAELAVSAVTIRRDLELLEQARALTRTHGGAVARQSARETSYAEKRGQAVAEKRAIAVLAATAVRDGDVLIIGPGSTTEALARELVGRVGLTVITNSLLVAQIFTDAPDNQLIMTGGALRPATRALIGDATAATLRSVRARVTFLSGNGMLPDFGLSTPDLTVAEVDRAMAAAADVVVALVDHTKMGMRAAIQTVAPERIHHVVTDARTSAQDVAALQAHGMRVHVAGESAGLSDTI